MTERTFWKKLKEIGRRFSVNRSLGQIRAKRGGLCPICEVARYEDLGMYSNYEYIEAGEALGLDSCLVEYVVDGADNLNSENRDRIIKVIRGK